MRRFSLISFLVVLAISVIVGLGEAAEIRWQGYTYHPTVAAPEFQFLEGIAKDVQEKTQGGLIIKMTPGGGLPIKGNDVAQAVSDRVVQFGACTGGTVGFIPVYGIARLPLLFDTEKELWTAIDEVLGKYIDREFDKKNVKLLAFFTYPEHSIWTAKHKITQLSDLKGLKIRTMTPQQADLLKPYGAIPVTIATGEVAPALQRGVVDGLLTASAGGGNLWIDMLKYNYRVALSWGPSMVIANKKAFGELPPSFQEILQSASKKWGKWVTDTMADDEAKLTKKFVEENGLIITPSNLSDIAGARKIAVKVWEETAAKVGPEGIEALKEVRALLGK
jgi:TRAP-type C4-dicarboxylate transport system substrate-binding protein